MIGDWNVVVSAREGEFNRAKQLLSALGAVSGSDYLNVLVMRVEAPKQFLEILRERLAREPEWFAVLGRLMPVTLTFTFQSPAEFESKASAAVQVFAPQPANKRFHVRMNRHGFKGRLSSHEEERILGKALLGALECTGTPGQITFTDPDVIVDVETLGNRAGLALWTREDLQRYAFLRLD
jgi:tRNA(Ser,Leu) C12 N-acetylase TAN1